MSASRPPTSSPSSPTTTRCSCSHRSGRSIPTSCSKAARAQTQAREHADRGELEIARKLLSEAAEDLRTTAPGSAQAEELLATAEMLGENFTSMSLGTYDPSVRKQMHYQSRTTSERRKR